MVIWRMIYRLFICAAEADYSVVFIILEQPNVTNLISIIIQFDLIFKTIRQMDVKHKSLK